MSILRHLGGGIYAQSMQDHSVPERLIESGYVRFLDYVWLPSPLETLSKAQIAILNRFREDNILSDPQFNHRAVVREAVIDVLRTAECKNLMEIGCGKFPLSADLSVEAYLGVEIDEEAIGAGNVVDPDNVKLNSVQGMFDVCVALFVFHFSVPDRELDLVARCLRNDGCIIFNMIVEDEEKALSLLARLSERRFFAGVIRGGVLSRREVLFVLARAAGVEGADKLARELRSGLVYRTFEQDRSHEA